MLPPPQNISDTQSMVASSSPSSPAWAAKLQSIVGNPRFTPLLFIGMLYLLVSLLLVSGWILVYPRPAVKASQISKPKRALSTSRSRSRTRVR